MAKAKIIEPFLNENVIVETGEFDVFGVLIAVEKSKHDGIGALVLFNSNWVIVRKWRMIRQCQKKNKA